MLSEWLGGFPLRQFLRDVYRVRPFAHAGGARASCAACSWRALDAMLASEPPPDALQVARGRVVDVPQPRSLRELRALFALGIGVVVRHAERQCQSVADIGASLSQDVPGEQRVLVFATPEPVHGFGWHYDAEEVFIVQTAGEKEYFFRKNTVDPEPQRGAQPDFSRIREETSPLMSCRLLPGDFLYLPRGYWHVAVPKRHSLSISIGIFPEPARA